MVARLGKRGLLRRITDCEGQRGASVFLKLFRICALPTDVPDVLMP